MTGIQATVAKRAMRVSLAFLVVLEMSCVAAQGQQPPPLGPEPPRCDEARRGAWPFPLGMKCFPPPGFVSHKERRILKTSCNCLLAWLTLERGSIAGILALVPQIELFHLLP